MTAVSIVFPNNHVSTSYTAQIIRTNDFHGSKSGAGHTRGQVCPSDTYFRFHSLTVSTLPDAVMTVVSTPVV
jgi:hypothetical protein